MGRSRRSTFGVVLCTALLLLAACGGGRRGGSDRSDGGSSRCSACPSGTRCDPDLGCVSGRACERDSDCDDEEPCTSDEWCDRATRTCVYDVLDGDSDGEPPRVCGGNDCDDADPTTGIGFEWCDGWDNDCDSSIDEAAEGCAEGQTCREGRCECDDPGTMDCGTGCVDVMSDAEHCGGCFAYCEGTCAGGVCDCGAMTFCSGGGCVDTNSDPLNCGSCGYVCGAPGTCTGGRCDSCGARGEDCCSGSSCDAGNVCSGGSCVACGGVGQPCCAGDSCSSGGCISGTCADLECDDGYPAWPSGAFPRCSTATLDCSNACTTGSCVQTCLESDATAPYMGVNCADCYVHQILYCADRMGCSSQLEAWRCCAEINCPEGSADTCAGTMCATEEDGFIDCLDTTASSCYSFTSTDLARCFP